MFESKQFASIDFGRKTRLYKAVSECLNDLNPDFGVLVSQNHNRCFPEIGRVFGFTESESGNELIITIQSIDVDGNDLLTKKEEILVPINQKSGTLEVNTWCDDLPKVQNLCDKKNQQNIAGLQNLIDKAVAMQENIVRVSGKSLNSLLHSSHKSELLDMGESAEKAFIPKSRGRIEREDVDLKSPSFGRSAEEGMRKE